MKKLLLLVVSLQVNLLGYAQTGSLRFDHFGVKDGLPESDVRFIKQDSRGYIWMGTQNGVLRFDGYKPEVFRFRLGKDELFSSCSVESMIEDNTGALWFSTTDIGLFKYNPETNSFTQYKYPSKHLQDFLIYYLAAADKENNLWCYQTHVIGTSTEVVKFNTKTGDFQVFDKTQKGKSHLDADNVNYISKTSDKNVWIGTNNGLYKYNYGSGYMNAFLATKDISSQQNVNGIIEDPSKPGLLWLNIVGPHFSYVYLKTFDTHSKVIKDLYPDKFPGLSDKNRIINNIYGDKQKMLWVTTANGLMSYDGKTGAFKGYWPTDTGSTADNRPIFGISAAKDGTLWMTTGGNGLVQFDLSTHRFQHYRAVSNDPYSISGNVMSLGFDLNDHLLIDNANIVWAAFYHMGVDKVNPLISAVRTYTKTLAPDSYPGGNTHQLVASKKNDVVLTTKSGIYKWQPGSSNFKQLYAAKKEDKSIGTLLTGTDGMLYFTSKQGFNILDTTSNRVQSFANISGDSTIVSGSIIDVMLQDHTGKIWLGTDGAGLCSFDPLKKQFKHYPFVANAGTMESKGKLDDGTVICIYEDKQGTLWFGTNLGGLSRFDRASEKFKSYLSDGNIRVQNVVKIFEDRDKRLWVGTYFNGLFEFDRKSGHYTRKFDETKGLLFNSVDGICQDKLGFLWTFSERGLTRIDPKTLSSTRYPLGSVLPGSSVPLNGSSFIMQDDHIVMNIENGIATIKPADLYANSYPPLVRIKAVSYGDPGSADSVTTKNIDKSKKIQLSWNQNKITFNYIALHFVDPTQNKYAYFLEGYDKKWLQAGTQRSVTYTNLPPATYTFHVKASNSDGVWNNADTSFIVVIRPPWWLTWWAWMLYIAIFAGSIYAFIEFRSRKLRKENQKLEEKIQIRTKELSVANTELHEQQEEITTQRDELSKTLTDLKATQTQLIQSEKMASLGELTAGIAHEIQNPLNFVNNFSEVSVELIDEMEEELDKGDILEAKAIGADLKQNLEKIRHHGKRADSIVKGMLEHSRSANGQKEPTDINQLADEYMRLSYHGLRAKDKSFNAELVSHLDPALPKVNATQQDIGRVMLNLFNNAFYAVNQKQKTAAADYKPEVSLSTSVENGQVIIKVKDNGIGMPDAIKEKIMQPFFTTKPTGEGTGLGLSLTYDMVVKGHGGSISVNSTEGMGSEFTIVLPLK